MTDQRIVDLSHPIHDGMITYPGLPGPTISTHLSRSDSRATYSAGTEFHIGAVHMVANTGTYIDAPFHRYPDGHDIAELPLDRIAGVAGVVVSTDQQAIGADVFSGIDTSGKAVLIRTGWDSRFGQDDYLGGHPHLTEEGAQCLVDGGALLVGIDSSNIDDTQTGERPAHSLLLAKNILIVEHLARLDQLPAGPFEFFAVPPPMVAMGTFPIRAFARCS